MPKNLIACRPASYGQYAEYALEHMASIGLTNAEVEVPAPDKWEVQKQALAKHKIKASSVSGGVDLSIADVQKAVTHLADGAKYFGAPIMFLSVKSGGKPLPECYKLLSLLGEIAKARGVTIALETHPDLVTNGDVGVATAKGTSHPNVKLNYDSANLYYYNEGIDGIAELKKFLPHTGAVHLKETNGKFKTWYFPGLHEGAGIVNFPEIFKLCNAAGFYGPFTMEIEGIEGEKFTREQACNRIAQSVIYLKSIGAM